MRQILNLFGVNLNRKSAPEIPAEVAPNIVDAPEVMPEPAVPEPLEGAAGQPGKPAELDDAENSILSYIIENNLSMVSRERLYATALACKHVVEAGIEGDFVECGVWRGGNALIAAKIFQMHGSSRRVFLFDTFAGMTTPGEEDKSLLTGATAIGEFMENQTPTHNEWCYASIEDVSENFRNAGVLNDNIVFVKGDVIASLDSPDNVPDRISVLRLDTDWYDSTRKELEVLYPRLSRGGVLMIDDYGHWSGAKKATDEYFEKLGKRPYLQYVDYTGRSGVKVE